MKKTIVIGGGSRGLGASLAGTAFASGYSVAVIGRDGAALKSVWEKLGRSERVSIFTTDLTDETSVARTFTQIARQDVEIRALVNCAATWFERESAIKLTGETLKRSFDLNFLSAFHLTQQVLAHHQTRAKTSELCVVNVGATASLRGGAGTAPFCIAKSALRTYSQSLARELGPLGIHVAHLIIDGLINNDRTRKLNPNLLESSFIDPESIAKSILHVIEQDSSCWTFEWDVRPKNEKW